MKDVLWRIIRFGRPHGRYLIIAWSCAIIYVSFSLLIPVIIGDLIDRIIGSGRVDFSAIWPRLGALLASVAFAAGFQWLMGWSTHIAAHRTVCDLRSAAFVKIHRLPLATLDRQSHGDMVSRLVADVDQVSQGLLQGFTQLFSGVVTIIGTMGFMFAIDWQVALAVVLLTPVSLFVSSFIARGAYRMYAMQSQTRGEISGLVEEMVSNHQLVKLFGYQARAQDQYGEINERLYDYGFKAQLYSSLSNPTTRFVNSLVYAAVGVLGAISAIHGQLSVGQLSCLLSYANQYTKPFNEISSVITELQSALASARRVLTLLDELPETPDGHAQPHTPCRGEVRLERVHFAYQPQTPLLQDISIAVQPGQRVAIVGPTGCGKTTLINLLMRFYDVDAGSICIDGVDLRHMPRSGLRGLFGMVLQDSWLFEATVYDNIAYAKPGATLQEVTDAAKAAHAHRFIKRLPDGYHTLLTDQAQNLSEGEKQLLCIARILLALPPMLILDEATSNIDVRSEMRIQRAFAHLMQGRTSFIVAHRLSTIQQADLILVMSQGNIVEQGTHDQLLKKRGFYAQLYESQFAKS